MKRSRDAASCSPAIQQEAEHDRVDSSVGRVVGGHDWTHATTLTFRQPRTGEATRRAVQRHLRDLAHRVHGKVDWFWVVERTHRGHVHIHALVDARLSAAKVRQSWKGGRG